MTAFLIFLMNLSPRMQKIFAYFGLGVGLTVAISPAWFIVNTINGQSTHLSDLREDRGRFEHLVSTYDARYTSEDPTSVSSEEFLADLAEPIIQAQLQNRLGSLAANSGAQVLSAGGVQSFERDGVKYIGLRANMQGDLPSIHNTLLQLESSKPYVIVKELTIRATNAVVTGKLTKPIDLSVQMSFFGVLYPSSATNENGEDL